MRIAHLSDLHFGRAVPQVKLALLEDLKHQAPHLVIISGDLTQRARTQEFIEAAAFIKALNIPVIAIPGNHDIPLYNIISRFLRPFHRYQKHISPALSHEYHDHLVAILAVNSVCFYRWKNGELPFRIQEEIRAYFSQSNSVHKILVSHHPLAMHESKERHTRAQNLESLLHDCDIDLLLSGHLHQSLSKELLLHPETIQKNYLMIHAGTAISSRQRSEANAYNFLSLTKERLNVEVRTFQDTEFFSASVFCFEKKASLWQLCEKQNSEKI